MVSKSRYPRILRAPRGSFFLFGLRGAGKTSWARTTFPDAHYLDLLDEELYQDLATRPAALADILRALPRRSRVVLDEVQRLPNLLNEVHRFIEERGHEFVLLGSSARKLKASGTNLLAGRAARREMLPLVPEELGRDFDLEKVLRVGSLPIVWNSEDPESTLASYVHLYLREEVRAEALVRNLPAFTRFLSVAALFHGRTINVSGLARDAATGRATVDGYLDILHDTLLTLRLEPYQAKLRVRERRAPKLYWVDPGIVRAVKRTRGVPATEERGALLEGWILTVLRAYAQDRGLFDSIHYWAPLDARELEVDFLLRRGAEFLALEVKSGTKLHPNWLSGLRAVASLPGLARRIVVFNGPRALRLEDGIEVWPVAKFLAALQENKLWP